MCPKCGREGVVKEHKVKVKGKEYCYLVVVHSDSRKHVLQKVQEREAERQVKPTGKTTGKTSKEVLDLERVLELAEKTVAWIKAREDLERFISSLGREAS